MSEKFVNFNPKANAKLASMTQSLRNEIVSLLGNDGILLYPSHPIVAPRHHVPLAMPFNFAYTGKKLLG